jgi:hypothetical protein
VPPRNPTPSVSNGARGPRPLQIRDAPGPVHRNLHSLSQGSPWRREYYRQQSRQVYRPRTQSGREGFTQNRAQNGNFREAQERGACEACSIRKKPVSKVKVAHRKITNHQTSAGSNTMLEVEMETPNSLATIVLRCVVSGVRRSSASLERRKDLRE